MSYAAQVLDAYETGKRGEPAKAQFSILATETYMDHYRHGFADHLRIRNAQMKCEQGQPIKVVIRTINGLWMDTGCYAVSSLEAYSRAQDYCEYHGIHFVCDLAPQIESDSHLGTGVWEVVAE
jgi:hypothetical protein